MSTAPRYPADMGYAGLRMSAEEYLALGETAERYELIDGVVVMSPSPTPRHQILLRYLLRLIDSTEVGRTSLVMPDVDVRLSRTKVYRPDLCIFAPGKLSGIPDRVDGPPDLVVEVLSPGSKPLDLITKRDDYDSFGVGEYWVFDPEQVTVRIWQRSPAHSLLEAAVTGHALESAAVPGLHIDLAELSRLMNA